MRYIVNIEVWAPHNAEMRKKIDYDEHAYLQMEYAIRRMRDLLQDMMDNDLIIDFRITSIDWERHTKTYYTD